jgi:hypothetical protein
MFRTVRNTSADTRPPQPQAEILPAAPVAPEPSAEASPNTDAPSPDQASGA